MPARSWSCTPWVSAPAIPRRTCEELARILTGAGIDPNSGSPKLKPERSRCWSVTACSNSIRRGTISATRYFSEKPSRASGFAEIEQAVDILCANPATAQHISHQLAIYFVSDDPPQAADRSHGPDLPANAGRHRRAYWTRCSIRRNSLPPWEPASRIPIRYVFSAVRLAYDDKVIVNTNADPELAQPPGRGALQPSDTRMAMRWSHRPGTRPAR